MIVYQYSETNVMYFLFSLLRIQGIYTFRTLLDKHHLVYCVRVIAVACNQLI
jgi:hypothetical protein